MERRKGQLLIRIFKSFGLRITSIPSITIAVTTQRKAVTSREEKPPALNVLTNIPMQPQSIPAPSTHKTDFIELNFFITKT